jgi:hypothetical protein
MPRFHFNVHDGYSKSDHEGTELPDWKAARTEAIRLAGMLILDEAERIAREPDWHMDVADEQGLILFRLDLTIVEAPVTQGWR